MQPKIITVQSSERNLNVIADIIITEIPKVVPQSPFQIVEFIEFFTLSFQRPKPF